MVYSKSPLSLPTCLNFSRRVINSKIAFLDVNLIFVTYCRYLVPGKKEGGGINPPLPVRTVLFMTTTHHDMGGSAGPDNASLKDTSGNDKNP